MPKPPRRPPSTRKTDALRDAAAGRPLVAKPADPRQAGLFDEPLPKWIRPCLPTTVDNPLVGPQWVHEIKWDGYRVSAYVADGKATIRTRNGHDWTARFPAIARAVAALKVRSAVLDGEAVILDERGRSSFAELQADRDRHGSERAVLKRTGRHVARDAGAEHAGAELKRVASLDWLRRRIKRLSVLRHRRSLGSLRCS